MKKIICVDPSFAMTGYCIFNGFELIEYDSFTSRKPKIGKKGQPLKATEKDIQLFYNGLKNVLENNDDIKKLVICELFSHNQNTLKALYRLFGIVDYLCAIYNIDVITLKESTVRTIIPKGLRVTDTSGKNKKTEWKKTAIKFFEREVGSIPINDDIADAYVVGSYYLDSLIPF